MPALAAPLAPDLCSGSCATLLAQAVAGRRAASEPGLEECVDCGRWLCIHRAVAVREDEPRCHGCAVRATRLHGGTIHVASTPWRADDVFVVLGLDGRPAAVSVRGSPLDYIDDP